jgi:hypothetical protein
MTQAGIKVAIRVRPFNNREKQLNSRLIVDMVETCCIITNPVHNSPGARVRQEKILL